MANLFDEYEASSSRSHHVARPRSDLAQLPVGGAAVRVSRRNDHRLDSTCAIVSFLIFIITMSRVFIQR